MWFKGHHSPLQKDVMGKYGFTIKTLGNAKNELGKFKEALIEFEEAEKFIEYACGQNNIQYVGILKRQARALYDMGSYEESEQKLQAAF